MTKKITISEKAKSHMEKEEKEFHLMLRQIGGG